MGVFGATSKTQEVSVSAIVIKKDGTVIDLGEVAHNRGPLKRLKRKVRKWLQ